jgi:hypothetical protein
MHLSRCVSVSCARAFVFVRMQVHVCVLFSTVFVHAHLFVFPCVLTECNHPLFLIDYSSPHSWIPNIRYGPLPPAPAGAVLSPKLLLRRAQRIAAKKHGEILDPDADDPLDNFDMMLETRGTTLQAVRVAVTLLNSVYLLIQVLDSHDHQSAMIF